MKNTRGVGRTWRDKSIPNKRNTLLMVTQTHRLHPGLHCGTFTVPQGGGKDRQREQERDRERDFYGSALRGLEKKRDIHRLLKNALF